jgi:DMSO/TMAO reductase YedYZ molybdopterin-dependent catalytic subunit
MILAIVAWRAASPFTACAVGSKDRPDDGWSVYGVRGMGKPEDPVYRTGDFACFWLNGTLPNSDEFNALVKGGFANYRLRVSGLVEDPQEFTYAQIKAMPKQEQITEHFCIQGWSGVAKWATFCRS